ncbi:plastocyanin/azurin family copper-binding protein [Dyadobacter sp. LHD-138]|uniref:plastocyanin/azurin family copper-binding protein n=1 Tax=Dyadobacter sp. LHD-138 TaxID=3071413 RepID=UPI0027E06111|nr:plastocyanin/azurin family copper-binding protein [Dyadobacter sp. LHD-138]MDQ6480634.1 plastocyanin/azurin family copper-binding protein [Dyadobacter sp. LHD-138]
MNKIQVILITTILFAASFIFPYIQKRIVPPTKAYTGRNHTIEIKQMTFSPANIVVKKGDRIIFVNHDMVTHDITEAKKAWSSAPLLIGKSWSMTVTQTAAYYCSIHPVMKGKIIVK